MILTWHKLVQVVKLVQLEMLIDGKKWFDGGRGAYDFASKIPVFFPLWIIKQNAG